MTVPPAPIFSAQTPTWRVPLLAAIVVFVLVYAVELANFTLSIDEEAATFITATGSQWVSQGRWGMGLLIWLLPNFEAIPLLSTVLFGVGLLFATMRGVMDFKLAGPQAWLYAVVHAGFPLWLHIAEFNTFAAGFGFGIAAAAYGAGQAVHGRTAQQRILAVVLLAFAIAVYQTLTIYAAVFALMAWHARLDEDMRADAKFRVDHCLPAFLSTVGLFIAALALYWLTQRAALRMLDVQTTYIDVYLQTDRLRADPPGVLVDGMQAMSGYLTGRDPMYLGLGVGVLFLSWLGLLPLSAASADRGLQYRIRVLMALSVAIVALALIAVPFVLSAGTLPIRAHVALPLLAAWLASRIAMPQGARWRAACGVALAYYGIVVCSIGSSLFYTERLVRDADAALTRQLVPAMLEVAGAKPETPIAFTLVGQFHLPAEGQIQRAGVFGTSFYEHDGGNVRRVALYMKTLGIRRFDPVWLGNRPDLIPAAQSMPAWPQRGSIRRVNGVVVVKLGPPTPPQLSAG
jgi:hypothetical protein